MGRAGVVSKPGKGSSFSFTIQFIRAKLHPYLKDNRLPGHRFWEVTRENKASQSVIKKGRSRL
jgi:hypothetical protein